VDGRNPGGGSRGLADLIDEFGEHIAADLLEVYGVDLRDIFSEESRLTPLYLLTLIRGLPESSRFIAERRGGQQFRGWDASMYAAVANVNAVRALQYVYVAAHSKNKPPPPEPFPVPDSTIRKPKANGPGSFAFIAASKIAAAKKARVTNG
jgi:hypothetical protein